MSDTTEAAIQKLRQEHPGVEAVTRELQRQMEGDAPLLVRFSELFFSTARPGFLQLRIPASVARLGSLAFRFVDGSRPDRVDVEVVNPDVDSEGWFAPVTVIRTNISERPFIVDTIREFLHSEDLSIEVYIYPVLDVDRDDEGRIRGVRPSRNGGKSWTRRSPMRDWGTMAAFTPSGTGMSSLIAIVTLTWSPTTSMSVIVPAGRPSTCT
jgi:NAD-specific glutamate dehydrogenase